jgi:LacI family transcriptional regulator
MNDKSKTTIHDIAHKLGITASTVSRALNNHPRISENTKKLVIETAKEINYKPNQIAVALRNGRSKLIGITVPTVNRNFFSSVVRGIEEYANRRGYKVIISQSYDDYEKEKETIHALLDARVDGIMVSIGKQTKDLSHFQSVINKGIPLVFFDRVNHELPVSQVVINDRKAAYQVTKHLLQQGYRKIAHFTSATKINIYAERLQGYMDALTEHGFAIDPELILESNMQLEDGQESVQRLLDKGMGFDAIFSSSDYGIVGAMQTLRKYNVRIPQEVGLAGFGNEPFTEFTSPALTTVDQVSIPMGEEAAKMFFDLMENDPYQKLPKKIVLEPKIIIRESSMRK